MAKPEGLTVAAEAPRMPDPSGVDFAGLTNPQSLLKYLQQLNQTVATALSARPIQTAPRREFLLIAPNGTVGAVRLKNDGTLETVPPGVRPP
jgi:hypothetical protein